MYINLLPPTQKQKRLSLGLTTYITLSFVTLLVVMIGFFITLTTIKFATTEKVNAVQREIDSTDKSIEKYASLEKDAKGINNKLTTIDKLLSGQMQPNTILDSISGKIGANIVLKSIQISKDTATKTTIKNNSDTGSLTIVIGGDARSRSEVIDFKRAIEADTKFNSVTYSITSADTASGSGTGLISFTINSNYSSTQNSITTK